MSLLTLLRSILLITLRDDDIVEVESPRWSDALENSQTQAACPDSHVVIGCYLISEPGSKFSNDGLLILNNERCKAYTGSTLITVKVGLTL